MKVYIDSGTHVTDPESRLETIDSMLESPEVVFIEAPERSSTVADFVKTLPYAPVMLGSMLFMVFVVIELVSRIIGLAFRFTPGLSRSVGPDQKIIAELESRYGAEPVAVDRNKLELIHEDRWKWAFLNWSVLAAVVWKFQPSSVTSLFTWAWFFLSLLLAGFILLLLLLANAHAKRNAHMAEQIQSASADTGEACIVLGGLHHTAVGVRLNSYEEIEVVNPEFDPPGLGLRILEKIFLWIDRPDELEEIT